MASGKNFRQEKRISTCNVLITAVFFVALCLVAAWVLNTSSEPQGSDRNDAAFVDANENSDRKVSRDSNESFEDSSMDPTLETEEKLEDNTIKSEEVSKDDEETSQERASNIKEPVEGKRKEHAVESALETKESPSEAKGDEGSDDFESETESKATPVEDSSSESNDGASKEDDDSDKESKKRKTGSGEWTLCDADAGVDYIPCLDNVKAIKALRSTKHYEHRERHCPDPAPTCLVPVPEGYRTPIRWPDSRNQVWYKNVPHTGLVTYKQDQQWVKRSDDRLIFPGGGTQFKHGALHYIDYVQEKFPKISWGKRTRVILDVGCGVASFGGYMFDRDVLTMSFAPKDEHEAQVQFALERGIPAISSVMGTQRLVFPGNVYDAVHCARCRVPWHIEGGKLILELNRVLRPGGYFVWSATPVYWTDEEDVQIWKDMKAITTKMCWKLVAKFVDPSTGIGAAIFQKPTTNSCYENREDDFPPMCDEEDKPDAAWYEPMSACIHRIPTESDAHGKEWPIQWPQRLQEAPTWLASKSSSDFQADAERWERIVKKTYLQGLGIEWKDVRNVMDMRALYGGFAAALTASQSVWVMNVVPFDTPNTLPVIFDRGLFGIYHDWCESFSSYPRTYDLLHADHLLSKIQKRCSIKVVIVEMDRLLRPGGWAIIRDAAAVLSEVQGLVESLQWDVRITVSKSKEGFIAVQKTKWRPESAM